MLQQESPVTQKVPAPHRGPSILRSLAGKVRGKVLLLLCGMYFITYVDRVSISTAAPFIKDDLHLSNTQLGLALSAFALPYAFFQIFGGLIGDRFGPRKVLSAVGIVWAVMTIATGCAVSLGTLFVARLGLGFGEGAAFPTATGAMSRWMPADRRGLAQGITHSASRLGNAIAPLGIAGIIALAGWRASFWVVGAISLAWVVLWARFFRDDPAKHPKMTETELAELPESHLHENRPPVPWKGLFRHILPVAFVDFCYGWSLWVYLTWIPSFFKDNYGLDLKNFAMFTSLVLLAGVFGDSIGGIASDWLFRVRGDLKFARRSVLVVGLLGSFVCTLPTLFFHNIAIAAPFLALAFFFLELTNPVLWSIPMDIAPQHAGTAGGIMNTGFGVAGILSPFIFGLLVDRTGAWQVSFAVSAALLFVGAATSFFINPTAKVGVPDAPKPAV